MQVGFRPIEVKDLALLRDWRNQERVRRTCRDDTLIDSMASQSRWFKKISSSGRDYMFLVIFKKKPVGVCGLTNIDFKNASAEISYHLGIKTNPALDVAISLEVYEFLKAKCFEEYNLNRLWGEAFSFNEGGVRLGMAAGFKKEGTLRESVFRNGVYWDSVLLGILKREYYKQAGRRPAW